MANSHRTHSRLAGRRWLKSPAEAAACPSSMQQSRFRIASYNVLAKCYAKARHFTRCKPGGSLCDVHLASPCTSRLSSSSCVCACVRAASARVSSCRGTHRGTEEASGACRTCYEYAKNMCYSFSRLLMVACCRKLFTRLMRLPCTTHTHTRNRILALGCAKKGANGGGARTGCRYSVFTGVKLVDILCLQV